MIEQFIKLFDDDPKYLNELCYWFAYILKGRFPNGDIWYDPVMSHFYFVCDDMAYDIRGQVVLPSTSVKWDSYQTIDAVDYEKINQYYVLKVGE